MANVLADLAIESEATTILAMRLAGAFDRSEVAFRRLALAVAKFWTCKRAVAVVGEALECHGGNGYVEESILPRLYREAPLNSIWEGSGNVNALDVLRAINREPESLEAYLEEVGSDPRLKTTVEQIKKAVGDPHDVETRARRMVELMAVALEASLMLRHGDPLAAELYCSSRLHGTGFTFGVLPKHDFRSVIERHRPRFL